MSTGRFRRIFNGLPVRNEWRIGYSVGSDWSDGGEIVQDDDETVIQPICLSHIIASAKGTKAVFSARPWA